MRNKQYALSYIFARQACDIPFPCNDVMFVEKELYDFTRYSILGCSALCLGDIVTSKFALQKALQVRPKEIYLKKNLEICDQILLKKG